MTEATNSTETVEKNEVNAQGANTENKKQESELENEEVWKNGEKFDPEKAQALIAKLRDEARGKKTIEKELAEYKKKEQAKADAELSELDRLKKEKERVEAENKQIKIESLRTKTAAKFQLPEVLIDRLKGETLEELEADAKQLMETLPKKSAVANPTNPGGDKLSVETEKDRLRKMGFQ